MASGVDPDDSGGSDGRGDADRAATESAGQPDGDQPGQPAAPRRRIWSVPDPATVTISPLPDVSRTYGHSGYRRGPVAHEQTRQKRKDTYKAKRAERLGLAPDDPNLPKPKITGQPRTRLDDARLAGQAVPESDKDRVVKRLRQIAAKHDRTLPTLPGVQSLSIATRYLAGGRAHFVELVQAAALEGSTDAANWLAVYGDLPPYQQALVSFDDVCAAAGVRPSRLVGDVTGYAVEMGRDVGNLVAAVTHPQVVQAAVQAAKHPKGTRDRELLFQHHNFTPVPRAAVINVNASATAQAAARSESQVAQIPSFADDLRQIGSGSISGSISGSPGTPAALPEASIPDTLEGTMAAEPEYDYVDAE